MLHRLRVSRALSASLPRSLPHTLCALPAPVAAVAPSASPCASALGCRSLHSASAALLAPRKENVKEKPARGGKKKAAAEEEADADANSPSAAPTLDSMAAEASARSTTRAPKQQQAPVHDFEAEARKSREHAADMAMSNKARARAHDAAHVAATGAAPAPAKATSVREEKRRAKAAAQAAQAAAQELAAAASNDSVSTRKTQKSVQSVIEKEVPLMDLTGLTPGQNKFANVLTMLRDQKFPDEVISDLEQVGDLATGSTAEILSGKLANLRALYGRAPHDTGSPEVQVAMLTERLKGYERHQLTHGADIAGRRGFLAVWHRRRKMLKYLRRTRYETYAYMMRELQLKETDIDNVGLDKKSATQAPRIKRD